MRRVAVGHAEVDLAAADRGREPGRHRREVVRGGAIRQVAAKARERRRRHDEGAEGVRPLILAHVVGVTEGEPEHLPAHGLGVRERDRAPADAVGQRVLQLARVLDVVDGGRPLRQPVLVLAGGPRVIHPRLDRVQHGVDVPDAAGVEHARHLGLEVGADLDQPAHARVVVRVLDEAGHAHGPVIAGHGAVVAGETPPDEGRERQHVERDRPRHPGVEVHAVAVRADHAHEADGTAVELPQHAGHVVQRLGRAHQADVGQAVELDGPPGREVLVGEQVTDEVPRVPAARHEHVRFHPLRAALGKGVAVVLEHAILGHAGGVHLEPGAGSELPVLARGAHEA